jgi:hypothetical protein
VIRGSPNSRTIDSVPSVEPSSTTNCSQRGSVWASALSMQSRM